MKHICLWLALVTLPLAGAAQTLKKPGEAASIGKVEIQGDIKPGGNAVANIQVKLEKNWHVQSNKPSEPTFIPTLLTLTATPGVKVGAINYPQGKAEKVEGLQKPLSVYEGDFQIKVQLMLEEKARLPLTIPAELRYQACQGATCYPPKKLKFDLAVGGEAKQP